MLSIKRPLYRGFPVVLSMLLIFILLPGTSVPAVLFLTGAANAATVTFSGFVNDSDNTALRNTGVDPSGSRLGPPLFGNDWEIANNVAIYDLSIPVQNSVTFRSTGYAAGGADPCFILFRGRGDAATFLTSNFTQAFSTGGDFVLSSVLGAGDYTVVMGVFANESFAENYGSGTLGDGFTSLGVPDCLRSSFYQLEITGIISIPIIQVTPSSLDFGHVPAGSAKDLSLTVKNVGAGTLTGTVTASLPFSIISGGTYNLSAGQSQQVVVRYTAPLEEGLDAGSLIFTGGGGITIQLKGSNQMNGLPWLMLLLGN